MYILHFVYPFDCKFTYVLLPLLAIVNSVGINMSIQIFLHGPAFFFFVSGNKISGSCGNSVFNFLRKRNAFPKGNSEDVEFQHEYVQAFQSAPLTCQGCLVNRGRNIYVHVKQTLFSRLLKFLEFGLQKQAPPELKTHIQPLIHPKPKQEVTCQASNAEYVCYLHKHRSCPSPVQEARTDLLRKCPCVSVHEESLHPYSLCGQMIHKLLYQLLGA